MAATCNVERAGRAHAALETHMDETGSDNILVLEEDVIDLLTDLRHYCVEQDIDFQSALEMSETQFLSET